jgi:formyltetrahydrofolate deformylase
MTDKDHSYILTISCPDTVGIVAAVTGFLSKNEYFIDESAHFGDHDTGQFFSRIRFHSNDTDFSESNFRAAFGSICERFSMECDIHDATIPTRAIIMVSKHDHCLNDLLYRYRTGALQIEIPAIVSNHADLRSLADWHNIPFHHVPVSADTRAEAEQQLTRIYHEAKADLLILARYMQILSDKLCESMPGKVINIHHSFLPGFKGSRPYHQAHVRGVKLIGATAHYVTTDLDEGPIIEQTVERVDHTNGVDALTAVGRDVEAITLARAVRYHTEHRVFLNGNRTVVFR